MNTDMSRFIADTIAAPTKKAAPILSFPAASLMGVTVRELTTDAALRTEAMRLIAERTPSLFACGFMDLSVEAEAFGAEIRFGRDEVPTVAEPLMPDSCDIASLRVPNVGDGRTGEYVRTVSDAAKVITDRPVMGGVIGPYSLAGRLTDVTRIMLLCYDSPALAHSLLERATDFITDYCLAYKTNGADGVILAEPLAGMLSPELAATFSAPYVRRIVDAVQDDGFAVCYHNCGNNVPLMAESIASVGAAMYHFGDAVRLADMLPLMPSDALVMGNISATRCFLGGTPEGIRAEVGRLFGECGRYPNFVPSSGCDIPAGAPWENIEAFFSACAEARIGAR